MIMMRGMETLISYKTQCVTIFASSMALVALMFGSNLYYDQYLPHLFFSNIPTTTTTTTTYYYYSPITSTPSNCNSSSSQPTLINPNTSLYPTFTNPKMQRAVENLAKLYNERLMMRRRRRSSEYQMDRKMDKVEANLMRARSHIKNAIIKSRHSVPTYNDKFDDDADYIPQGDIYRNAYVFQRSYMVMESMFKIYVYEEGEPPLFHNGPTKNKYSSEGLFIKFIEEESSSSNKFRTRDPDEAHVYFLPYSVVMILEHLFDPVIRDKAVLGRVVGDYVRLISTKYSYWNRSLGADHFMLSCHDWGPRSTWYIPQLYFTSMRVLCNANTSEFFNPRKDISIPEINLPTGDLIITPNSSTTSSNRTILAFFAGQLNGKIRPFLFKQWNNKDKDIQIHENIPQNSYEQMMANSKYCLCPSGHEVASPRIVEAIYAECVPVLISKDYVLPFSDVLDWDKFSVSVSVGELSELKRILLGIGEDEYRLLQEGVRKVKRHFMVNDPPKRYDVFHMMIHSLWLRRLNLRMINA